MCQRRRNDSRWLGSSRSRSSYGGSSGDSDVMLGGGTGCGGVGDSARAETSARASWRDRASKETRRSGDEAVPRISPGSGSWYPVKGINCRPEETKRSKGFESAFTGSKSTM